MYGLKRNTERLFSNNGKLFVMAMDLPQTGMVNAATWDAIYDQFSGIETTAWRDPQIGRAHV